MSLRSPSLFQQLLFGITATLLLVHGVSGQDVVLLQNGTQQAGKVTGSSASGVQITIGAGSSITLPMSQVKEVRMNPPAEFFAAQKALEAKNYDAALSALQVVNKYKGLPAEWAQQAAGMLGDVLVEKGDLTRAETAYRDYQKLYPGAQGSIQSDVGMARLDLAKKNFADAKSKLQPIVSKAVEEKEISRANGLLYSQAFYIMGQVKESEGDFVAALDNYLKTVTIFYQDRAAALLAQEKADALRKAHPLIFIP
jgi:tetratricopeptide (TPR) repeat protein